MNRQELSTVGISTRTAFGEQEVWFPNVSTQPSHKGLATQNGGTRDFDVVVTSNA